MTGYRCLFRNIPVVYSQNSNVSWLYLVTNINFTLLLTHNTYLYAFLVLRFKENGEMLA